MEAERKFAAARPRSPNAATPAAAAPNTIVAWVRLGGLGLRRGIGGTGAGATRAPTRAALLTLAARSASSQASVPTSTALHPPLQAYGENLADSGTAASVIAFDEMSVTAYVRQVIRATATTPAYLVLNRELPFPGESELWWGGWGGWAGWAGGAAPCRDLCMPAAAAEELHRGAWALPRSPRRLPHLLRSPHTPAAVKAGWTSTVHREAPAVTGVGLEKMTIEFAWSQVGEHFTGGWLAARGARLSRAACTCKVAAAAAAAAAAAPSAHHTLPRLTSRTCRALRCLPCAACRPRLQRGPV